MPSSKNGGNIKFGVDFEANQASLNKLKKSLQDLQKIKLGDFKGNAKDFDEMQETAKKVQIALEKAFNPTLNTTNISTFQSELQKTVGNIDQVYNKLKIAGPQGEVAFHQMATEVLTTNLKLKQTNSLINSMGKTMVNTVKWGIASSVMNIFTQSVQGAFQYVQSLERSLTNIRIVTGDSTEKMAQFAEQANKSAQALGRSTLDYTKASLTYYQQGLSDQDVQARTEATLKAQNITGAGDEMADYLTAVWNGYKVANEEAEVYVDKLAAVADSSASDMSQLAIAMSKVASTANTMGVDIDQLNAQIATVVATTKQAPESVGTAFKTIYSRMNDIKAGSDEAEISLGNYSGKMAELGFNVLDATGHLRDTGQVMEEIGGRWQELTKEQQVYLAQTMGGQRQVNQLMALFDNWTTYSELLNTSLESEGTLAEKNARYMESLGAKMEQLGAAGERVKDALINEDELKGGVDALTNLVTLMGNFIESIGGGSTALLAFGSLATQVFQDTIARQINNVITNIQNKKNNELIKQQDIENTRDFGESQGYKEGVINNLVDRKQAIQQYYDIMSEGEVNAYNNIIKTVAAAQQESVALEKRKKVAESFYNSFGKNNGYDPLNKDNFEDINTALGTAVQDLRVLNDQVQDLSKTEIKPDSKEFLNTLELAKEKINELFKGSETQLTGWQPFIDKLKELQSQSNITEQDLNKIKNAFGTVVKQAEYTAGEAGLLPQTSQQAEMAGAKLRAATKESENFQKQIQQLASVRTFTQTLAGIGQLAAGIKSLTNLTKVWGDENLSAGEKLLQTITNVSMSIPMIINGFSKMSDTLSLIKTGIQGFINQYGSLQKAVESFATARKIAAAEEAGAENLQLLSQEELQAAYEVTGVKAWASLGPYVAIAAAVAAAVGLIVLAYKDWNKEADAAKKASEVAADAKKTYDDLKTSLDEVKSSLDDLHAAEDNLDGLTRGTQEWRDALQQCNDKVLELISNYPELAQYVSNENGQLKLSAEGEQAYLDQLQAGVQNARNASYIASSNSREADAKAAAANIGHNSSYGNGTAGQGGGFASSEDVLKVVGSLDKILEDGTSDLSNGLVSLSDEIAEETGLVEQEVSAILANEDAVLQLKTQLEQNANADKLMYEAMAANALQNNSTYKSMDDYGKQVANAMAGSDLDAEIQRIEKELIDTMTIGVNKWSGASNSQVQSILEQLNEAQGTNWKLDSNAVRGTDTNRAFAFLDQAGQLHTYTKQQIASTIAAKQALQNLGTSAEKAAQILSSIDTNISDKAQEAVKQWVSGQQITATTQAGLNELKGKDIQDIIGDEGAQALAQQWDLLKEDGTADIQALNERWKDSCNDMSNAFYTVAQDASISVQKAFNSIKDNEGLKNATLDFQRMVVGDMQKALAKDPTGGLLKNITDFYGKIQDFEAFDDVIEDFDFSKGPQELKKQLEQIGAIDKNIDLSNVQVFVNLMKQASQLSPEQSYKNVHDITDKLKRGDSIDAEQAQVLKGAGVNVDAFFQHMADGSLKLKTNAETFQEYINNITIEPFKAKIDDLQNKINGIHAFEDSKYSADNMGWEDFSSSAGNIETVQQGSQMVQRVDQSSLDTEKLSAQLEFLKAIGVEDQNIGNLQQAIGEKRAITAEELKGLNELLIQQSDKYNNLSEVEKQHLQQIAILQEQMANANDPGLDQDVDEDKWEKLSEHLQKYADQMPEVSDELKNNADLTDDLAQAMLRYDSAIGQVKDNYDDWLKALQSGSIEDQVQATEDLENVYSDLLDLPFDNVLSADFLQNVDNLNLLKEAANGSEQAYNSLAEAAAHDIAINAGMDTSDFEAGKDLIENYTQDGVAFDDIEVGAFLDDANFIQGLNEMINATEMGVDQATDLLSSMGVDAEVEAIKVPEQDKHEFINATAKVSSELVDSPKAVLDATTGTVTYETGNKVSVPTITYDLQPTTEVANKDNTATVLRVKSARKASGGGFKYKNSSAGNKGGGGGGKHGGGGGGGGSKPKQAKKMDAVKGKPDRYRNNTVRAGKLADKMQTLSKQQERLTGKSVTDNLKEQLDILEKQKGVIEEKLNLQRDQQNELQQSLKKYGASFGEDGTLTNYGKVFQNIEDAYNKEIAWYNTLTGDEQEEESVKARMDAAKKQYDEAMKNFNRYDTLTEQEMKKTVQDRMDKIQEIIDKQVQTFKIKIDATIDLGQARRQYEDFVRDVVKQIRDDDFIGQNQYEFRKLASYMNSNNTGTIQSLSTTLDDILKNRNGIFSSRDGKTVITDSAQQMEQLKKYLSEMQQELGSFKEGIAAIKQSIFDGIDQTQAAFDEQMAEYEYIGDLIDHNVKVIKLMYGDDAYQQMANYYDKIENNNNKQLDFLRQQKDMWYGMMMEEEKRMQEEAAAGGTNSNLYKEARDRFQAYKRRWMDSVNDLNAKVEDSIENIIDKYTNQINLIFRQLELKWTNGLGFDTIQEEWEQINDLADMYLDKINSMYELEKLQGAYQDAIDSNKDNVAAQQSLNDMMKEQLAYLKDKDRLSQYDVDRANALLQIEVKRLALENTRNNKSKLRLRRDSQGNYSYQYVANNEESDKSQKELADAQNELWNLDVNNYKNNLDEAAKIAQEATEKMAEVYADSSLTTEQQQQKIAMLTEYYENKMNAILADNISIRNNLMKDGFNEIARLYGINAEQFEAMTEQQKAAIMKNILPQMGSFTQQLVDQIAGAGGFYTAIIEPAMKMAKDAQEQRDKDLNEIEKNSGQSIGDILKGIDDTTVEQAEKLLDANDKLVDSYENQLKTIQASINAANQLVDTYRDVIETAQGLVVDSYQKQFGKTLELYGTNGVEDTKARDEIYSLERNARQTANSTSDLDNYKPYQPEKVTLTDFSKIYNSSSPTSMSTALSTAIPSAVYTASVSDFKAAIQNITSNQTLSAEEANRQISLISEKMSYIIGSNESLLNSIQKDTNIESILSEFDNKIGNIKTILANETAIQNDFVRAYANKKQDRITLDQNVKIQANFPQIREIREIEQAFIELQNRAAQLACEIRARSKR